MDEAVQTQMELTPVSPASSTQTEALFSCSNNQELATLLSWKKVSLLTLLGMNKSDHYSILYLRKKGSTTKLRTLYNPDSLMRAVQFRILTRILNKVEIPDYIHAFEKGKNIPDMARLHVGKALVVSMDLKDFFPSIKQRKLLSIYKDMGFADAPARTLSELGTYKSFVAQGALTSPKISNIVTANTFGPEVKKYCDEQGFTLSIYADDVTISMSAETLESKGANVVGEILQTVSAIVESHGFRVNRKKTKVMRPSQRQYVCGVVVNSKVNLQKSERRTLRAIVHNCMKNGFEVEAAKSGLTGPEFYSKTMGRLNWFGQLNPEAGGRLKELMMNIAHVEVSEPMAAGERVEEIVSLGT